MAESTACKVCGGRGLIPLPRGMTAGFYRFMGAGATRSDDGTLLMLCYGCKERKDDDAAQEEGA